jgi:hypothetical protein
MRIVVFIDANAWNFFFERNLDLSVELPCSEFQLMVTREAELENRPTRPRRPHCDSPSKA